MSACAELLHDCLGYIAIVPRLNCTLVASQDSLTYFHTTLGMEQYEYEVSKSPNTIETKLLTVQPEYIANSHQI